MTPSQQQAAPPAAASVECEDPDTSTLNSHSDDVNVLIVLASEVLVYAGSDGDFATVTSSQQQAALPAAVQSTAAPATAAAAAAASATAAGSGSGVAWNK